MARTKADGPKNSSRHAEMTWPLDPIALVDEFWNPASRMNAALLPIRECPSLDLAKSPLHKHRHVCHFTRTLCQGREDRNAPSQTPLSQYMDQVTGATEEMSDGGVYRLILQPPEVSPFPQRNRLS
jgi:hypothetical protein